MREQLAHRDWRTLAVRQGGPEGWEPAGYRVVERELAAFYQNHCRSRDNGLGERCETEQCVQSHRPPCFPICQACCALVYNFTVARNERYGADDAPGKERLVDHTIDFGCQRRLLCITILIIDAYFVHRISHHCVTAFHTARVKSAPN